MKAKGSWVAIKLGKRYSESGDIAEVIVARYTPHGSGEVRAEYLSRDGEWVGQSTEPNPVVPDECLFLVDRGDIHVIGQARI